jgi:hypothetical protein
MTKRAMELLTYLSPTPVPLATLVDDMGLETQASLRPLIDGLRADGFQVATGRWESAGMENSVAAPGTFIWIDKHGWARARAAAEKWWNENMAE